MYPLSCLQLVELWAIVGTFFYRIFVSNFCPSLTDYDVEWNWNSHRSSSRTLKCCVVASSHLVMSLPDWGVRLQYFGDIYGTISSPSDHWCVPYIIGGYIVRELLRGGLLFSMSPVFSSFCLNSISGVGFAPRFCSVFLADTVILDRSEASTWCYGCCRFSGRW